MTEKVQKIREEVERHTLHGDVLEMDEIKEPENEKIRKEMIEIIKNEAHEFPSSIIAEKSKSWIAWLEKQGKYVNFCNKIQIGDKVTRNKDGVLVNLSQLNRVAKPIEK